MSALLAAPATAWRRALSLASAPWMRAASALLTMRLVCRPAMVYWGRSSRKPRAAATKKPAEGRSERGIRAAIRPGAG